MGISPCHGGLPLDIDDVYDKMVLFGEQRVDAGKRPEGRLRADDTGV